MTAEEERTRLIREIACVLRAGPVPDDARSAALTFIGWLARRMPGEPVSLCEISRCRGTSTPMTPMVDASTARPPVPEPPSRRRPRGRCLEILAETLAPGPCADRALRAFSECRAVFRPRDRAVP